MKISFVLGHELPFPPERGGGVNSLLDGLSRALASEGHEVTAYSPLGQDRPAREIAHGVRHIRLAGAPRQTNHLYNAIRGLPYALAVRTSVEPCDVLSCHMLHAFLFAKAARVVTHTLHRDPKGFLKLFGGLDRIYTGSEAVSGQARVVAPALAHKVRTVHNCVDFHGYEAPEPRVSPTLKFIFAGRFSEDKGVDILIRAFAAAATVNPHIELTLVGPIEAKDCGDERLVAECRAYIRNQGLEQRIRIEPPIFDRARLDEKIRGCDVVCLGSVRGETLNMSIIESMRLGKALLVSDLPANAPLVREGFNGHFCRTGDEADWADKILRLAANREEVAQFGVNSYRYGIETFSSARIARDYVADFSELLAKSRS